QVMLGISRHAAYDLLTDGSIRGLKLGNAYKIPKINVIRYVVENGVQPAARAAGS
ncbi:MAG TPA: helix-turn-helix domain-containing protein, partial [Candidatus Gemmiger avium]|nr:helix-turn-helix domain-containing protein [Candidatus Gemmiger avium]